MSFVFGPIRDKIERAARNGEKLHLDVAQVRALVRSPIYETLSALTAQEFASQWPEDQPAPPPATTTPSASSSAHSGSGIVRSATNGASAGTLTERMAKAVEQAERAQAWEAVMKPVTRRKKL